MGRRYLGGTHCGRIFEVGNGMVMVLEEGEVDDTIYHFLVLFSRWICCLHSIFMWRWNGCDACLV